MFFGLGMPGALVHDLRAAGFDGVEEFRIDSTLFYEDRATLVEAMIDGGAVALAAKRFTPEIRAEVDEAFVGSVAAHHTASGSYEIPGEFVVATGVA